jgi:heptosyltransferase I
MNILIVKLSAIGDVIHTLPALHALRNHFPQARITWLVEEAAAGLVIGHESLDRVLVSKRKHWIQQLKTPRRKESIRELYQFIRDLRDTRYDLVLDFQALLKSGVLIGLTRAHRKIGFDKGMEHMEQSHFFLNERVAPVSMEVHALTRNLMLLDAIGIPHETIEYRLPISRTDRLKAMAQIDGSPKGSSGPVVIINPVAKWDTKLWDPVKFARLADGLIDAYAARVIFTGAREDVTSIDETLSLMTGAAMNLAGETTLMNLAALYERADLVISTDTGPMHLAAAVNTPVVALFGPTAPWRTGPFGANNLVMRVEMPCSPCFKRYCETRKCMGAISVDRVFRAASGVLGSQRGY